MSSVSDNLDDSGVGDHDDGDGDEVLDDDDDDGVDEVERGPGPALPAHRVNDQRRVGKVPVHRPRRKHRGQDGHDAYRPYRRQHSQRNARLLRTIS